MVHGECPIPSNIVLVCSMVQRSCLVAAERTRLDAKVLYQSESWCTVVAGPAHTHTDTYTYTNPHICRYSGTHSLAGQLSCFASHAQLTYPTAIAAVLPLLLLLLRFCCRWRLWVSGENRKPNKFVG